MLRIRVDASRIVDQASFHRAFRAVTGLPAASGCDMDGWIDGMTRVAEHEGIVAVEIAKAIGFRGRCPELFAELVECIALVNHRFAEEGRIPRLALIFM